LVVGQEKQIIWFVGNGLLSQSLTQIIAPLFSLCHESSGVFGLGLEIVGLDHRTRA